MPTWIEIRKGYWFGKGPSDPLKNERVLGTIGEWKKYHNCLKQRGFNVDVTEQGDPVTPDEFTEAVRAVIGHVRLIGLQLRLGKHIEGEKRLEHERDAPPATDEEIENMRALMRRVDPENNEKVIDSMRGRKAGRKLNNADYAFAVPENPFENVAKLGYLEQDRELFDLMEETSQRRSKTTPTRMWSSDLSLFAQVPRLWRNVRRPAGRSADPRDEVLSSMPALPASDSRLNVGHRASEPPH